ncbi:MAG: hypothetical protein K0Q66_2051 [Chitinophagaceae bacterium]|jgi:hypothetical protein|nr:hypothetical protein [Chitinophagaceae bacterium]
MKVAGCGLQSKKIPPEAGDSFQQGPFEGKVCYSGTG